MEATQPKKRWVNGYPDTPGFQPTDKSRCHALLGERNKETGLHLQCRQPSQPGRWFCSNFHPLDRDRSFGTVWQHRASCEPCTRSAKNGRPTHPSDALMEPLCAPDPPKKVVASTDDDSSDASSTLIPTPLASTSSSGSAAHSKSAGSAAGGAAAKPVPSASSSSSAPSTRVASSSSSSSSSSLSSSSAAAVPSSLTVSPDGLLHEHPDPAKRALLNRYVGPTGIKLCIRLARCLQPANWTVNPPVFTSCLEPLTGFPSLADTLQQLEDEEEEEEGSSDDGASTGRGGGGKLKGSGNKRVSVGSSSSSKSTGGKGLMKLPTPQHQPQQQQQQQQASTNSTSSSGKPAAAAAAAGYNGSSSSYSKATAASAASAYSSSAAADVTDDVEVIELTGDEGDDTDGESPAGESASSWNRTAAANSSHDSSSNSSGSAAAGHPSLSLPAEAWMADADDTTTPLTSARRASSGAAATAAGSSSSESITGRGLKRTRSSSSSSSSCSAGLGLGAHDGVPSSSTNGVNDSGATSRPSVGLPMSPGKGAVAGASSNDGSSAGHSSSSSSHALPPATPAALDPAVLRELHKAALSIDLEAAPVRGDSWLSSTLIDAVAFEFARAYPDIHFLATNVLAFELPHASKSGRLATYTCADMLGRTVALHRDALPPVTGLPTSKETLDEAERKSVMAALAANERAAAVYGISGIGLGSHHHSHHHQISTAPGGLNALLLAHGRPSPTASIASTGTATSNVSGAGKLAANANKPTALNPATSAAALAAYYASAAPTAGVMGTSSSSSNSNGSAASSGSGKASSSAAQQQHMSMQQAIYAQAAAARRGTAMRPPSVPVLASLAATAGAGAGGGAASGSTTPSLSASQQLQALGAPLPILARIPASPVATATAVIGPFVPGASGNSNSGNGVGSAAQRPGTAAGAASPPPSSRTTSSGGTGTSTATNSTQSSPGDPLLTSLAAHSAHVPHNLQQKLPLPAQPREFSLPADISASLRHKTGSSSDSGHARSSSGSISNSGVASSSSSLAAATSSAAAAVDEAPTVMYAEDGMTLIRPRPIPGRGYDSGNPYYVHSLPPELNTPQWRSPGYGSKNRPLVFFWNIGNMHWNLIRVSTGLVKAIEVFEPMGKPAHRSGSSAQFKTEGLSLRSVPRHLIEWLDVVCPLATEGGWRARTVSAITSQQQGNGFDCGVACLLYAEKCGQRQEREDIGLHTDQQAITWYRQLLQEYFHTLASAPGGPDGEFQPDG